MLLTAVGSLATSLTDPWTLLCGASGGCYALIGAHLAVIIMVNFSFLLWTCFFCVKNAFFKVGLVTNFGRVHFLPWRGIPFSQNRNASLQLWPLKKNWFLFVFYRPLRPDEPLHFGCWISLCTMKVCWTCSMFARDSFWRNLVAFAFEKKEGGWRIY